MLLLVRGILLHAAVARAVVVAVNRAAIAVVVAIKAVAHTHERISRTFVMQRLRVERRH